MKINTIIIEDEPLATEKLTDYISKTQFLHLQASFNNVLDAMEFLKKNNTDLIFLDIKMNPVSGLEFLTLKSAPAKIIITSAYGEYAVNGYEHQVFDFLLKPFGFDRFLKAVHNLSIDLEKKQQTDSEFIFIKTEYRIIRIDLDEIHFIEGMKDYLCIATTEKKIKTLMSFKQIMQLLPSYRFARVHKSFIVALDKIKGIERGIILTDKGTIPITETYKDVFFELLKNQKHII